MADWSDYVRQIKAATTREELGAIYVEIVGYDRSTEAPEESFEDLQELCIDFMREVCCAFGVHVSSIGI